MKCPKCGAVARRTARCGVDFCEDCGDCLACYGGDPCPRGSHVWPTIPLQCAGCGWVETLDEEAK